MEDICAKGGYVAILDMNEELAQEVVSQIGGGKTKFFEANVLETESIAAAVKGALAWSKETGMEIGGVVAAAGVSTPAKVKVCSCSCCPIMRKVNFNGVEHEPRSCGGYIFLNDSFYVTRFKLTVEHRFLTEMVNPSALMTSIL